MKDNHKSRFRTSTQFTKTEISQLYNAASSAFKGKGLHIKIAPKLSDYSRILIVIPRKVGSAPERNLLRRHIKHAFYENKLFELSHDAIIQVFPQAKKLSFQEIEAILLSTLSAATPDSGS